MKIIRNILWGLLAAAVIGMFVTTMVKTGERLERGRECIAQVDAFLAKYEDR